MGPTLLCAVAAAGPFGCVLHHRQLTALGVHNVVVRPHNGSRCRVLLYGIMLPTMKAVVTFAFFRREPKCELERSEGRLFAGSYAPERQFSRCAHFAVTIAIR
jgi:hypothetical protein